MDKRKILIFGGTLFGAYLLYKGLQEEKITNMPKKIIETAIETPQKILETPSKILGKISKRYDDLKDDLKDAIDVVL
jgi:hypothetical protein